VPSIDPVHAAVLVGTGIVTGWINTVAGAGGVIAIPALMLWGLPAPVANGTLRVAILAQSLVGSLGYLRAGALPRTGVVATTAPAVVGAFGGAYLATQLTARAVEILLLATFAIVIASALHTRRAPGEDRVPRLGVGAVAGMLVAGFYGGLVQTGVGLVLLAVLTTVIGHDLLAANALKVVTALAYSVVALIVFARAGQVDWLPGALLGGGSMLGALLGVRFAVKGGHAAIRIVVIAVSIAGAVVVILR